MAIPILNEKQGAEQHNGAATSEWVDEHFVHIRITFKSRKSGWITRWA